MMTLVPAKNRLLAALRPVEYLHMLPKLEAVTLEVGSVLCLPHEPLSHAYFPEGALISLLSHADASNVLEVGMLGSEGVLGCTLALGAQALGARAVVQRPGRAMRMRSSHFVEASRWGQPLYRSVNQCIFALMGQIMQISVCNRFHAIEARLARWLLMTCDRVGQNHMPFTQDMLADCLGVRRAGVSQAAQSLKRKGLIDYRRAWIAITDAPGLELASCACYQALRVEDWDAPPR